MTHTTTGGYPEEHPAEDEHEDRLSTLANITQQIAETAASLGLTVAELAEKTGQSAAELSARLTDAETRANGLEARVERLTFGKADKDALGGLSEAYVEDQLAQLGRRLAEVEDVQQGRRRVTGKTIDPELEGRLAAHSSQLRELTALVNEIRQHVNTLRAFP